MVSAVTGSAGRSEECRRKRRLWRCIAPAFALWLCCSAAISRVPAAPTDDGAGMNEAPYIATYYIKPTIKPGEEVAISFYITDYWQKEYRENDTSETFTVRARVEGQKEIVQKGLKAGDHTLRLGTFRKEGEVRFSLLATDRRGRNSHELFNFFLVRSDVAPRDYVMKAADLAGYGIRNDDTYEIRKVVTLDLQKPTGELVGKALSDAAAKIAAPPDKYLVIIADTEGTGKPGSWWKETVVNYGARYDRDAVAAQARATRDGLQKLLDEKAAAGFTRVRLLPGTYRVDHTGTLFIPSGLTLDMNGATLKMNPHTGDSSLMVSLNDTFDAHLVNGVIEGDYYGHDYEHSAHNSEWVCGIALNGAARYSSFRDLVVKDITGYGGCNGIAKSRDGTLGYTYTQPKDLGKFALGDIDRTTGAPVPSTVRSSCGFVDIPTPGALDPRTKLPNPDYIQVGVYLGYQGNPCGTWNILCHFYRKDATYIASVDGYLYRRVRIPAGAARMRVTILSAATPDNLSAYCFRVPTHCAFKNVRFVNCRCVGLAQSAMNDMLVEGCEFTRSGQASARCAYDAEDGWDMMQDVTFRNLRFHDNPANDFLTCAGHNFVVENLTGKAHIWNRTNGLVLRNSENAVSLQIGPGRRSRTGYYRVYGNTFHGSVTISAPEKPEDDWKLVVRDSTITGRASAPGGRFVKCGITGGALGDGEFWDCHVHDVSGENRGGSYRNCRFENITGNMHGTFELDHCTITGWKCNSGGGNPNYLFRDCTLTDFSIHFGYWFQGARTLFENCTITSKGALLELPHYAMKQPVSVIGCRFTTSGADGIIRYYDDRTGGSAGELTDQKALTLQGNTLQLGKSPYVVTGLTGKAQNPIHLAAKDNRITPAGLPLCNPEARKSRQITVVEQ